MALTDQQYADNERKKHEIAIRRMDEIPLRYQSDARASYRYFLWEENPGPMYRFGAPRLGRLAERTKWLLAGDYGYEPRRLSREAAVSHRTSAGLRVNRAEIIGQLIAAYDHNCTAANARKAWRGLSPHQQSLVNWRIESAIDEWLADPENQE